MHSFFKGILIGIVSTLSTIATLLTIISIFEEYDISYPNEWDI